MSGNDQHNFVSESHSKETFRYSETFFSLVARQCDRNCDIAVLFSPNTEG
jgi:hypothetical protein